MPSHRRTSNARARPLSLYALAAWHQSLTRTLLRAGIRAICPDRYSSTSTRRLGDWPRLHVHHAETATARDQGRGQEPHSGKKLRTSYCQFQVHSDQESCRLALTLPSRRQAARMASTIRTRWTLPKNQQVPISHRSPPAGGCQVICRPTTCPVLGWIPSKPSRTRVTCNNRERDNTCPHLACSSTPPTSHNQYRHPPNFLDF